MESVIALRAYRWSWQSSSNAIFETAVFSWILCYRNNVNFPLDVKLGLLILALIHDRLNNLKEKFYFVVVSVLTTMVSILMIFLTILTEL